MSSLSGQARVDEEQSLRDCAQQLRDLTTCTAGAGYVESIESFAGQAENYADLIRDAISPELAAQVAAKAASKRTRWTELIDMLTYSIMVENQTPEEAAAIMQEAVQEAEAKMRRTAEQLRAVADTGTTSVFGAIGAIATEAETGLAEFLAATKDEEKLEVYGRVEEARTRWLESMQTMQNTVADDDGNSSQAATEANDPAEPACEYVDEGGVSCTTAGNGGYGGAGAFANYSWSPPAGCFATTPVSAATAIISAVPEEEEVVESTPVVAAPPVLGADTTPEQAKEQLVIYLKDEEEGFLATLRKAVGMVKADDRFQGVHEDADKLLEQMVLASGAVIPEALQEQFSDDVAGAEEKMKAIVEPMRAAQWGGFYAKKAAFTVRKYDMYVRKGKMPKLADEHAELLECAMVAIDLAEYLRKEAQGAIMDSVTSLVAATTK